MKLINEKGKLFGIINVVDLLVLLAIFAVIGGIAWQLAGDSISDAVAQESEMVVHMAIKGANENLWQEFERQDLLGENLIADSGVLNATITDVWLTDYEMSVNTADGEIVKSTDPSKKNIWIEVTTTVPKGTVKPSIGSQEIRAGREFIFKTVGFESNASIYYVEIAD